MLLAQAIRSRRGQGRRGTATVEMAFVLPVMLVLIFGTIDFAWVLYCDSAVTEAAHVGARYAMVHGAESPSTGMAGPTANDSDVATAVQANVPGLDPNGLTITSTWPAGTNAASNPVTVTVSYSWTTVTGRLVGFTPRITLSGTSTMIITY